MRVLVGTSGWSYKEWKGSFYPKDLAAEGMLRYYAGRLPTVEINNSFYRMPSERVLVGWSEQVPPAFRFVLKASRRITHLSRLEDEESLAYFLRTANVLGDRLGPTLFQLPPTFKKDMARLQVFLSRLPKRWAAAIEFRHATWFDDEVYDALRARDVALVAAEDDDGATPLVPTTSWGYLRLRRTAYDSPALAAWAARIRQEPWKEAYVFLKHDEDGSGTGPQQAEELQQLLATGE